MTAARKTLFLGDCLLTMSRVRHASLSLVYFDPPFMTGRKRQGTRKEFYFDDYWSEESKTFLPWLQQRLAAAIPLIAPHGSLVVHLDYRTVHYVKVWLDQQLGIESFVNEIIWHYTGGGRSRSRFSCKHDTLLWYAPRGKPYFNPDPVRQPYKPSSGYARCGIRSAAGKQYLPDPRGTPPDDVWDIPIINPMSAERVGWPTQKPLALMERLILALTAPNTQVGDFMCGSGTTLVAAARLGRDWIGGDQSESALECARKRLQAIHHKEIEILRCDTINETIAYQEEEEHV